MLVESIVFVPVFFAGALCGSYAGMLACRAPLKESFYSSCYCPACGKKLSFLEQIPVLSYLAQKGKCRVCFSRIPPEYLAVEIAGGIVAVAGYLKYGFTFEWLAWLVLCTYLLALTWTDIKHHLLPNRIVFRLFLFGLVFSSVTGRILFALAGALFGGMSFLYVYLMSRGRMGAGDVKMAAALGTWLGLNLPVAFFVGLLPAFPFFIKYKKVPLGPFLALGAAVTFWNAG